VNTVGDFGAGAQHERRRMNALAPQLANDLEAIPLGKSDVENHEIGLALERARKAGLAVARFANVVAFLAQHALQESHELGTIFDEEDRRERRGRLHAKVKIFLGHIRASLESGCIDDLLFSVNDHAPSPSSLPLGLVVAGATTGALIAIGHRLGSIGLPFAAIAASLLRRTATSADPELVTIGVGLHIVVTLCWSALFVWLVRDRVWRRGVAAIVVAGIAHVVSWIVAWTTGNGIASQLPLGDRIVLAVVLAASLAIGIRFAFSGEQESATSW